MYGNTNLIGIGPDYRHLKFRGPGSVGTPTLSTHVGRYYIVLNNHNPRVLVERCDYISAYGWGTGGADAQADGNSRRRTEVLHHAVVRDGFCRRYEEYETAVRASGGDGRDGEASNWFRFSDSQFGADDRSAQR
jgi:hypothetical protein